jgi:uncharacterized protein DUF4190/zinc ribbon protein
MNCTTCDTPLDPGVLFCPNCGARVQATTSAGAPTAALPSAYGQLAAPPSLVKPTDNQPAPPSLAKPSDNQPVPAAPQWVAPAQPGYASATPPNSVPAVVSLVCGILSWLPILPVVGAICAIIAGHIARKQIRESGGRLGGSGMATAGLILGYLQIAVIILAICAFVGFAVLAALGSQAR